MAFKTEGTITLNELQVFYGRDSGATVSLNADLGEFLNKNNSETTSLQMYYGANPPGLSGSSTGLKGKRFNGYYADNPNFFNSASLHGDVTNNITQINNFSSSADYYSWLWVGTFLPSATGTWTFYTSSDDASHLWVGDPAIEGSTTSNVVVNNGGTHGNQERQGNIYLEAGTFYPIRAAFGEAGGGDIMTISFAGPGQGKTTNGDGYYFDGEEAWDEWVGR